MWMGCPRGLPVHARSGPPLTCHRSRACTLASARQQTASAQPSTQLAIAAARQQTAPIQPVARDGDDDEGYQGQSKAEAIALTQAIMRAKSCTELSYLHTEHQDQLWDISLAALYTQLAKLTGSSLSAQPGRTSTCASFIRALEYTAGTALNRGMAGRELCTIASAAARLYHPQPWLCEALESASHGMLTTGTLDLRQAAQLTYAFAQMAHRPSKQWQSSLLQRTSWLMAQAALKAAALSDQLNQRRRPQDSDAHSQTSAYSREASRALANLAHALVCKMRLKPPATWLSIWCMAVQQVMHVMEGSELLQCIQVLAGLQQGRPDDASADAGEVFSTQWLLSWCDSLSKVASELTPAMAQAALCAAGQVAGSKHTINKHPVVAVLLQRCCEDLRVGDTSSAGDTRLNRLRRKGLVRVMQAVKALGACPPPELLAVADQHLSLS